ncbi:ABC transporter ATP-binding protein [Sinomonas atrocyanea]|uniref:ABC transporter ATP-binding protein n=1 Tax=Sinomonas atrocyanea TaxID=37927 RepID=UPI00277D2CC7|nr:ABC transporter ATP-binding protein [Sinomonas atrocyanea]MDQ0259985.1 energy-coupling factor transport system ATP-binding protein [Sinomonas atrocyanea]MDR6620006.1 energy-coupling factor transport system ATP-binding protein [Sinomonas atrocyanea]
MSAAATPVLSALVERFAYDDGPPVLRDVRLALGPGTLTAVLGASGSGTSTLARVLAGWGVAGGQNLFAGYLELGQGAARQPAGGSAVPPGPRGGRGGPARLVFRGRPDDPRLRLGAWGQHVAYVPQRPGDLLTGASATVGEEIAFALEQRAVPRGPLRERTARAAEAVGLGHLLGRDPAGLSGGEQRRLALACAIIAEPAVLILDDPTASLDAAGSAALWRLIAAERARGAAVVLAGACADPIARRADHWVLLRAGTAAAEGTPAEVLASAAFAASGVLARDPGEEEAAGPGPVARAADCGAAPRPGAAGPLAALEQVAFAYPGTGRRVLDGADLAVAPGEVVALTGPNGAGKSTALRHLAGLLRPQAGRVRVAGADIAGSPAGRVADQVGTLFQEPRDQLFERTALREVSFGLRLRAPGRRRLDPEAARSRALGALEEVGLAADAGAHPYDLPASAQRLLALATVLARRPRVLLLDEPTVWLDGPALARLEAVVARAAEAGAGVVLSTHALAWATRRAHRVLSLEEGRFVPA